MEYWGARDDERRPNQHKLATCSTPAGLHRVIGDSLVNINTPTGTWRNNNVIITSNEVATSIWRNNDVIIASRVCWDIEA